MAKTPKNNGGETLHPRASTSAEDTPLMPPYMFESTANKTYIGRIRTFQCTACIMVTMLLITMFTLAIVQNIEELLKYQKTHSAVPPKMLQLNFDRLPFLNRTSPLPDKPSLDWAAEIPTKEELMDAIKKGKEALRKRKKLENELDPLEENTPASRAQRSVSTAPEVKPLAEAAYAIEEATRSLIAGSDLGVENVGLGPSTVGLIDGPQYCGLRAAPCPITRYRSQDGTCNNLQHPHSWGVSNTPYRRVLPAHYHDGISAPRERSNSSKLPSARDVSLTVHRPSYPHDSTFTVMLAVWGQMVDHDVTSMALSKGANNNAIKCCGDHPSQQHPECFPVELAAGDPFYSSHNLTCMEFVRAAPATTCHFGPREQLNQATGFLDASAIYGYTETTISRLRHTGGELRMLKSGMRELLPPSKDPNDGCNSVEMIAKGRYCFESGDERANENLHLTTMHLIWARQHNRLARELRALNPGWSDDTIFQETRRIIAAQMQHITYTEFLPSILGRDVMYGLGLNVLEKGYSDAYDPTVDPSIANHFASAAFRFAHTLLPGLIHAADSATGTISYIHLHEILFNPFALYTKRGSKYAINSGMHTLVHTADPHVTSELTEHLFERTPFLDTISNSTVKKEPCGLDLVSLNIQRGRDNGLPTYPNWREVCGLTRPRTFDDLRDIFDESSLSRIEQIYESVDDIDLYTGGLAEQPHGRLLGPTFTCLIADQFLRLKVGDRFWYETSDPVIRFSEEQLSEIRKTTLAGIFCANEVDLEWVQPRIMEAATPTNPLMQCDLLPQPTFGAWLDEDLPRSKKMKKN